MFRFYLLSDTEVSLELDTIYHQDGMSFYELRKLLKYYSWTVIKYNNGMGYENAS